MKKWGLVSAIAILFCTNALALILAARNRAGEPFETIELTERELMLQSMGQDNSGVTLSLSWHRQDQSSYFDRQKMETVGFDFRIPPGRSGKDVLLPPRAAYAALEFEGEAWDHWSRQPEGERPAGRPAPRPRPLASRLFPVDISRDAAELRSKYPDQKKYLIVAAVIQARVENVKDPKTGDIQPNQCFGFVAAILPSEINIPLPFSRLLAPLNPEPESEPRYTVTLAYGHNLEPWVAGIRIK